MSRTASSALNSSRLVLTICRITHPPEQPSGEKPSSGEENNDDDSLSTGGIVGIVVGILGAIVGAVACWFAYKTYLIQKEKRERKQRLLGEHGGSPGHSAYQLNSVR